MQGICGKIEIMDNNKQLGEEIFNLLEKEGFELVRKNPIKGKRQISPDARRIGRCIECNEIYYASRRNKIVCSKMCSNRYHQRKLLLDDSRRKAVNEKRRIQYRNSLAQTE